MNRTKIKRVNPTKFKSKAEAYYEGYQRGYAAARHSNGSVKGFEAPPPPSTGEVSIATRQRDERYEAATKLLSSTGQAIHAIASVLDNSRL